MKAFWRCVGPKIWRAPDPFSPIGHKCTYPADYGVGFDDVFDRSPSVCRIGKCRQAKVSVRKP
jgi:hypothetical protein